MVAQIISQGVGLANLPVMSPIRQAIRAAVEQYFAAAVHEVNTQLGLALDSQGEQVDLDGVMQIPAVIRSTFLKEFAVNMTWPTLSIITYDSVQVEGMQSQQSAAAGLWEADVELHLWDEHSDGELLTEMMDRYFGALWLVVNRADPLAGYAWIVPGSFQTAQPPVPEADTSRVVGVAFRVGYQT